jgi:hypothetical protein
MVFIEFIFVLGPMLLLVLGVTQVILLQAAQLTVMRASNAAARAAIVVLDDDPAYYGGEARNAAPTGSRRHAEIRRAAAQILVAVHPPNRDLTGDSTLADAIATPAVTTDLPGLLTPSASLLERVTVTLDAPAYGPRDPVTVEVAFRYRCAVPLVRRIVCPGGERLVRAHATLSNQAAAYGY